MNYLRLSDCAIYRNERTKKIDYETYITTENILPNRGGVIQTEVLPDSKTVSKYLPNDILLSNIRPYFKKIWFSNREGGCSNDVLVVKAKTNVIPQFLYYVLSDNNFFNYDNVTSKGTKMPRGTPNAIMKYLVPDISKQQQKRIVSVLSAYDNLIEVNNKRIKVLEQMAENLYKEWFVRFRFPGHETAEFENGIPKGWEISKISDIATIKAGGDKPDAFSDAPTEECPIPIFSNGLDKDGLYGYTNKAVIENESVTISARGTVGFVCLRRKPYVPIVRLVAVIPKTQTVTPLYLYYYLRRDSVIANGTSQQQITVPMVSRKRMIIPPASLLQAFDKREYPIWNLVAKLKAQNENLIQQRDLLLPRLMSGKLEAQYAFND